MSATPLPDDFETLRAEYARLRRACIQLQGGVDYDAMTLEDFEATDRRPIAEIIAEVLGADWNKEAHNVTAG